MPPLFEDRLIGRRLAGDRRTIRIGQVAHLDVAAHDIHLTLLGPNRPGGGWRDRLDPTGRAGR